MESPFDLARLAQDLQLRKAQVASVIELLESGNTVPFITRYRKERTGGLDEEKIRAIQHRVGQLKQIAERRLTILRTIESQGKLTDEIKAEIEKADSLKRLEDLYLPYKPRKQTLATIARERGLEPLALAIWTGDEAARDLEQLLPGMINPEKQLNTTEDVLTGVQHIVAELIAENADVRQRARDIIWSGKIQTSRSTTPPSESPPPAAEFGIPPVSLDSFRNYFKYEEPISEAPPHRLLAINRGERRGVLKVKLDYDRDAVIQRALECLNLAEHPHRSFIEKCVVDAVDRLLLRSLEREVRGEVAETAEMHAVEVFARNLRNLLLQPPVHGRRVLAIDPGYRTGCKWAVVDEFGNVIEHGTVFPHMKRRKKKRAPGKAGAGTVDPSSPVPDAEAADASGEPSADQPSTAVEQAPILPADSVHRSTEPEGGEEHGLEAEIEQQWQEIKSAGIEGSQASPIQIKRQKAKQRRRKRAERERNPATAGIVIPPPGLFDPPASTGQIPGEDLVSRRERAKQTLIEQCQKHRVDVLAIGNGSACRETEELIAEIIAESLPHASYVIVNEAGASVYSTSSIGREEFPHFDATLRSAISIGRRLQDPLSELVKIDPQNIGVGLYQHDINPRLLKDTLSEVVESCVNFVGVDVNTASAPLLRYVSGLNQLRAKNLIEHRQKIGPFTSREQIRDVPGIGPESYTQAAGFLKITSGEEPLDRTWIHPESYVTAEQVLTLLGYDKQSLVDREQSEALRTAIYERAVPHEMAEKLSAGEPTIWDILDNLVRPGLDPREDLPQPIFKKGVLRLEDLEPGMELKGTVLNVVDFGVFVDIGLKDSGLVHISELADRFIRTPHDVVAVGDIVTTWVLKVDDERRRVSLTMLDPNREKVRRGPRGGGSRRRRQGHVPRQTETAVEPRPQREQQQPSPEAREQKPRREESRSAPQRENVSQERQLQPRSEGRGGPPPRRARQGPQREYGKQERRKGHRADKLLGDKPAVVSKVPKEKPPVTLTDDKIAGKGALNTFGELKALFELKKKSEQEKNDRPKEGETEAS